MFELDAKKFREAAQKAAVDAVLKRLRRDRCPVHGRAAKVTVKGAMTRRPEFGLSACCEAFRDTVIAMLKG